jgi:hypothetical protein
VFVTVQSDVNCAATALFTEYRPFGRAQHVINIPAGEIVARSMPAGQYAVTVFAPGYSPYRTSVLLSAGGSTNVIARLKKVCGRRQALPTGWQSIAWTQRTYNLPR